MDRAGGRSDDRIESPMRTQGRARGVQVAGLWKTFDTQRGEQMADLKSVAESIGSTIGKAVAAVKSVAPAGKKSAPAKKAAAKRPAKKSAAKKSSGGSKKKGPSKKSAVKKKK